jgi:hypothetical protein
MLKKIMNIIKLRKRPLPISFRKLSDSTILSLPSTTVSLLGALWGIFWFFGDASIGGVCGSDESLSLLSLLLCPADA